MVKFLNPPSATLSLSTGENYQLSGVQVTIVGTTYGPTELTLKGRIGGVLPVVPEPKAPEYKLEAGKLVQISDTASNTWLTKEPVTVQDRIHEQQARIVEQQLAHAQELEAVRERQAGERLDNRHKVQKLILQAHLEGLDWDYIRDQLGVDEADLAAASEAVCNGIR